MRVHSKLFVDTRKERGAPRALPSSQGRILGSIKFSEGGIGLDEDDPATGAHQVKEHAIRLDVRR
jgi:hypothetical protein